MPDAIPLSFQSGWTRPDGSRAGVVVGASGVTIWEKSGPGPQDEWGREFSWSEWVAEGSLPSGAPPGLAARVEAIARRFAPSESPRLPPGSPPARQRRAR